ncbi:MAG: hypothetical protein ACXWQO_11090 [Bdellovibrionota bacterium]
MKALNKFAAPLKNQEGRVGYLIAWMLGVPTSVLFFIFLLRGH